MSTWGTWAPPPPPPPPQRKRHRLRTVLLIAGFLLMIAIVTAIINTGTKTSGSGHTQAPSISSSAPAVADTSSVYSPPVPKYVAPTKSDFKITLKVVTQDCFGDAGCVVTYEPKLQQLSLGDFDPSVTYDVTYEVRGDQNGPQIDTLQVTGSKYSSSEGTAQTSSSGVQLRAVITDVEAE